MPATTIQQTQRDLSPVAANKRQPKARKIFHSIDTETRSHVETDCAGYWLTRASQTMRLWASTEAGPIRPIRINGRLAWPVADIRRLLNGGA